MNQHFFLFIKQKMIEFNVFMKPDSRTKLASSNILNVYVYVYRILKSYHQAEMYVNDVTIKTFREGITTIRFEINELGINKLYVSENSLFR